MIDEKASVCLCGAPITLPAQSCGQCDASPATIQIDPRLIFAVLDGFVTAANGGARYETGCVLCGYQEHGATCEMGALLAAIHAQL